MAGPLEGDDEGKHWRQRWLVEDDQRGGGRGTAAAVGRRRRETVYGEGRLGRASHGGGVAEDREVEARVAGM